MAAATLMILWAWGAGCHFHCTFPLTTGEAWAGSGNVFKIGLRAVHLRPLQAWLSRPASAVRDINKISY